VKEVKGSQKLEVRRKKLEATKSGYLALLTSDF
jgi:hypothetical protein